MFRRFQLLVLFSFCVFNLSFAKAFADSGEVIVSGMNAGGQKMFLVLYQENKSWRVDEIVEHADGWEDLISRKYYSSRAQAEQAQTQMQAQLVHLQAVTPFFYAGSAEIALKGGSIWPTTQAWSWEWEKKYAQWLTDTMTTEYFNKYGVATDCADVAYAARWIFARIHGLPAANRISGNGALMTNQSARSEWQSLPTAKNWYEDKRFRAALNYLLNLTYTHSLMRDSYPVAITPENFLPGIHHLDLHESSGHTQLVHRVDLSDKALVPYLIVQSTVPRKVRVLNESMSWSYKPAEKGKSGYLRILWPKVKGGSYSLEKAENMPGYSLEQFATDFIREKDRPNFLEVLLRLKPDLNYVTLVKTGFENLSEMFKLRVGVVEEGYTHCPNRSCAPESSEYDDWSTPSRDRKIIETIEQLDLIASPFGLPKGLREDVEKTVAAAKKTTALQLDGQDYSLNALIFAWRNQMYSSDPNDVPGLRWGLAPEFVGMKMQRDFVQILAARKKKINFDEDNRLRGNILIADRYCGYFDANLCGRFSQQMSKSFEAAGQTRTLQEWLDFSLWLNADPLQTPANQWGGVRAKSKFQKLAADLKTFQVSKDGIGFMENNRGEKRLGPMGVNGLEDAVLPADFKWESFVKEDSVGWALAPQGRVLRHDFRTGDERVFTLPNGEEGQILRARSGDVLILGAQKTSSFEVQGAQLVPVWSEALAQGHFSENFYFAQKQNGAWSIYDFTQALPREIPAAMDLTDAGVFKVTAKYVGVRVMMNSKSFFYERSTGAVTDVSSLGYAMMWSEGLSKAVIMDMVAGGVNLVTLNSQFQVVAKKKIADFGQADGDYLTTFEMMGTPRYHHMKGEELVEVAQQADEEGVWAVTPPWMLVKLKNGQFRLREIEGRRVIYQGDPVFLISKELPEWVFAVTMADLKHARVISVMNPKAPAMMTGDFFSRSLERSSSQGSSAAAAFAADRGLIMSYQGISFWVEFPQPGA